MPMDQVNTHSWRPNGEVCASYDFAGESKDDLPFQRGDLLVIVTPTSDPNWYRARSPNVEGMIPANYVQLRKVVSLHAVPWFHGKISRQEAEALLQPREDGLFLVRESSNYPGDYTLCMCYCAKVEH